MPFNVHLSFSYDDPINNRGSLNNRTSRGSLACICTWASLYHNVYTLRSHLKKKPDDILRCLLLLGISNWIAAILLHYWWIVRFSTSHTIDSAFFFFSLSSLHSMRWHLMAYRQICCAAFFFFIWIRGAQWCFVWSIRCGINWIDGLVVGLFNYPFQMSIFFRCD